MKIIVLGTLLIDVITALSGLTHIFPYAEYGFIGFNVAAAFIVCMDKAHSWSD